ncbi:MAG: TetR/AcrR family transcriptional regulator [Candidatus Zixiibacteriota bacterium]
MKRENIVRAASRVFGRRGIYDFKMIDIANEAGIGKGTLYEYFRSKEEIISGAYKLVLRDYKSFLEEKTGYVTSPVDKLRGYIRLTFEFFEFNDNILRLIFDFWAAGISHRDSRFLLENVDESYRETVRHVKNIIDEGIAAGVFKPVDSEGTATLLLAVMDGLMFPVVLGLQRLDSRKLSEVVCQTVLEGIMP